MTNAVSLENGKITKGQSSLLQIGEAEWLTVKVPTNSSRYNEWKKIKNTENFIIFFEMIASREKSIFTCMVRELIKDMF